MNTLPLTLTVVCYYAYLRNSCKASLDQTHYVNIVVMHLSYVSYDECYRYSTREKTYSTGK